MNSKSLLSARKHPGSRTAGLAALASALALTDVAIAERPAVLWTRAGHSEIVLNVQTTPDNDRLVTAALDGTVKVWDSDGQMLYSLNRHGPAVTSPDGQQIAVSVLSNGVDLRNLSDGALVRHFGSGNAFAAPAWSPDGALIADIGADRSIRVWNVATGALERSLIGHTGPVRNIAWSADGSFVVSGAGWQGVDNTARIWSPTTGQALHTLSGHSDFVFSVAVSSDSQIVATGSGDHTIKLWQASSGGLLRTLSGPEWTIFGMAFSPDGQKLASVDIGGPLRIWRVSDGTELHTIALPNGGRSVAYGNDGQTLIVGSITGPVELRNPADGALLETIGLQHHTLAGLQFASDGRSLAYGHDHNSLSRVTRVRAYDGSVIDDHPLAGYLNFNGVIFSPDLSLAATLSLTTTDTQLWDTATGLPVRGLSGHVSAIYDSTFSPDGTLFATAGEYQSGLWNVATGELIHWFLNEVSSSGHSIAFSADGSKLALSNRQFAQVYDVATAALLHDFTTEGFGFSSIALSDDGQLLAASSEDQLFVWRLSDDTLVWSDPNPTASGTGLIFSHDGERLYSSGRFSGIQIRATSDGTVLQTYDEEIGESITSLALSPGERNLAYTRTDATIVLARNPFWMTGDTNADGCVDLTDLATMLSDFGLGNAPARADFNDDGVIDLADLSLMLANFGTGCG